MNTTSAVCNSGNGATVSTGASVKTLPDPPTSADVVLTILMEEEVWLEKWVARFEVLIIPASLAVVISFGLTVLAALT